MNRKMSIAALWLVAGCASKPMLNEFGNPLKRDPQATSAAITDDDLRTRLYIFSDDSMMGRQAGREGNTKGTNYIAKELARLGVEPAGEGGTYFQGLPWVARTYGSTSSVVVNGRALRWMTDWAAVPSAVAPKPIDGVRAIYGGVAFDTSKQVTAEQARGRVVVLSAAPPGSGPAGPGGGGGGGGGGGAGGGPGGAQARRLASAAAIIIADWQTMSPSARALYVNPPAAFLDPGAPPSTAPVAPPTIRVTTEVADALFGAPIDGLHTGGDGPAVSIRLALVETPVPQYGRNVVGIIRGSDPQLKATYVAIGAHNDHIGFNGAPVDHDSARAVATAVMKLQMQGGELKAITPEQRASIKINMDSLHLLHPVRLDSISNGADDDGSGSVAVLEIAEAIAAMPVKPKRSILFVFHTGEERGLLGSRWYTDHPTVPRDSIVTQINIDMIGRGRAEDIPGGGPDYLAVVGSKRLSAELGKAVVAVNQRQPAPLKLDYKFDDPTTWPGYNNIYGRSDHANYARYNIPIAFFFTGLHQDYHRVTDEAQYIDYPHMAKITRYLNDLTVEIANRERRPVVDGKTGTVVP